MQAMTAWAEALGPALIRVDKAPTESREAAIARRLQACGHKDICEHRVSGWLRGIDVPRDPMVHQALLDTVIRLPKKPDKGATPVVKTMAKLREKIEAHYKEAHPLAMELPLPEVPTASEGEKRNRSRPYHELHEPAVLAKRRISQAGDYENNSMKALQDIAERTGNFGELLTCIRLLTGETKSHLSQAIHSSETPIRGWERGHFFPNEDHFTALHEWVKSHQPKFANRLKYLFIENHLQVKDSHVQAHEPCSHTLPRAYYKAQIAELFGHGKDKSKPEWSVLVRPIITKHDYVEAMAGLFGGDEMTVYNHIKHDASLEGAEPRAKLLAFFEREQAKTVLLEANLPENARSPKFFDRSKYDELRTYPIHSNGVAQNGKSHG